MTEFPFYPVPPEPIPPKSYPSVEDIIAAPAIPVAARLFRRLGGLPTGGTVPVRDIVWQARGMIDASTTRWERIRGRSREFNAVVHRSVLLWERALLASRLSIDRVIMLDAPALRLNAVEIAERIRRASPH